MTILTLIRHGQSSYNLENRFTGNVDVALTPLGEQEALSAGKKIKAINYDIAYTSILKRAQKSLAIILQEIHQKTMPVVKNGALDERKYGDLQGLNKEETAKKYGEEQVLIWRRSFAVRPPGGESLEDTYNRTVPYYQSEIEPKLKNGENVLIVAHGNSLRALMMYLEKIDNESISKVNIPTGTPRNYTFDGQLNILKVEYL